jgi:multicomponent Na+:H+ antiporter subunit D
MLVLPLALPWLGAAALGALDGRKAPIARLAALTLAAHVAALAWLALDVFRNGGRELVTGTWPAGIGIVLRADALSVSFALLSSAVLLVAVLHELGRRARSRSFPALVLFLAAGLTGLFLTADIFNFFVFFELSMIAAYVLSAHGGRPERIASTFIFAVVNLLGSFLFLLGVAATYNVTGTLEMTAVAERMADVQASSAVLIAALFFVAFGVKLGLFPFHFWLPPVYAGATPAVAAILSGALANIGAYGLLRFGAAILPQELELASAALLVLGTVSILYGALQALSRRATTEVLAYSAIGQAGYVLVALAVGGPAGYAAAIVYAVVNSANKVLLFLAAGRRGPLIALAFAVGAFSVVGVPPAAGFVGKLEVFRAALDEGSGSAALVAVLVLGSALSFVYMFQLYQHDYWREGGREGTGRGQGAALVALAAVLVVGGVWPEPLLRLGDVGASVLVEGAP